MGRSRQHELANALAVLAARAALARAGAARPEPAGTVLLVEDEPTLRHVVQEGLAARGWNAVAAGSAEEALGLAAEHADVDAVVTDLVLPRMTGRALVERLRRARPRLRVVFVSGHPPDPGLVGPGASAYLQKPFTLDELDAALRALLAAE